VIYIQFRIFILTHSLVSLSHTHTRNRAGELVLRRWSWTGTTTPKSSAAPSPRQSSLDDWVSSPSGGAGVLGVFRRLQVGRVSCRC